MKRSGSIFTRKQVTRECDTTKIPVEVTPEKDHTEFTEVIRTSKSCEKL